MNKIYLIIVLVFSVGLGLGFSVNVSGEEALIPSWIKTTAGFWVDDQIGDKEFVQALQWLIDNGVLQVTQKDPELEQLEQEMAKRMLKNMLKDNDEDELVVGIGFECISNWSGNTDEQKYLDFKVEVMNHDSTSHSVIVEIQDVDINQRSVSSKQIQVDDLQSKERRIVTGQLEESLVGGFCNAIIKEIK